MGKNHVRVTHVNVDVNELVMIGFAGLVCYAAYRRYLELSTEDVPPVLVQIVDAVVQPIGSLFSGLTGK